MSVSLKFAQAHNAIIDDAVYAGSICRLAFTSNIHPALCVLSRPCVSARRASGYRYAENKQQKRLPNGTLHRRQAASLLVVEGNGS